MTEALPELRDSTPEERLPFRPGAPAQAAHPPQPPAQPPKQQTEASRAKWERKIDWEKCTLAEGMALIAEMRAELELGSNIIQNRSSREEQPEIRCFNPSCAKVIDVGSGRFAGMRTRNNFDTGLPESAYACSSPCFMVLTRDFA